MTRAVVELARLTSNIAADLDGYYPTEKFNVKPLSTPILWPRRLTPSAKIPTLRETTAVAYY